MPGKRVHIDPGVWPTLQLLARDRMMSFQELADEAFDDLLNKYGRRADLKSALRKSARVTGKASHTRRKSKSKH